MVPIHASVIRKVCHLDSATSKPGTEEILAHCLRVCWVPSADSGKNEKIFFPAMRKCFSSCNFDYTKKTALKRKAGVF